MHDPSCLHSVLHAMTPCTAYARILCSRLWECTSVKSGCKLTASQLLNIHVGSADLYLLCCRPSPAKGWRPILQDVREMYRTIRLLATEYVAVQTRHVASVPVTNGDLTPSTHAHRASTSKSTPKRLHTDTPTAMRSATNAS